MGEAPRLYGPENEITQFLMGNDSSGPAKGVEEAFTHFFENGAQDLLFAEGTFYRHHFDTEVVPETANAVFKDDWTGSFLGGYDVQIRTLEQLPQNAYLVEISVLNNTGWDSATRIPFSDRAMRPDVPRIDPGPGGTMRQFYTWTGVISNE